MSFQLPKKSLYLSCLTLSMLALAGCKNNDGSGTLLPKPAKTFAPIELTLAHINDHHSHLDADTKQDITVDGVTYTADRGGFARVSQLFADITSQYGNRNLLKLHAGDALTGTSYYSYYQGAADADMMNTVCFDASELGNHEFDDGDGTLKTFIDRLHAGSCQTPVLGANVKPKVGTPLAPSKVDDYIKPYTIKTTKEGVKVGIIGIDIKGKTKNSSRPLDTTEFLEEKTTAQNYINELQKQGIEHIVLLTHQGYDVDQALARELTGVDVIIGGDSHTLLGDFSRYANSTDPKAMGSQGSYPTITTNKNGETVCIGHAWEYAKAVGLMNVKFNDKGSVASCGGSTIIPIGQNFTTLDANKKAVAVDAAVSQSLLSKLSTAKADLLTKSVIYPVAENPQAVSVLAGYKDQLASKLAEKIGVANDTFCLVRVPGTSNSGTVAGCENSASYARGSDAAQLVAKAFLDASLRADFSLQNGGGVRTPLLKGDITNKVANDILPFSNTLVNLTITGSQVIATLEDAVNNASFGINGESPSTGAHPYADGLRWDLDLVQPKGKRVKNVEVRDRKTGTWSAIDPNKTYVMVTNDYIASGKDGYATLAEVSKNPANVEDTKILYSQGLIDYLKKVKTVSLPARSDYSHKTVITAKGTLLNP